MCGLGWKSLGVLELTALPSIREENWVSAVQEVDALLVWGGSPCISATGCAVRAGRPPAVAAAQDGLRRHERRRDGRDCQLRRSDYDDSDPLTGSDKALGLVDFSLDPHLEREDMPETSIANIERWAAGLSVPAYAIDDQTAIKVADGTVEVVSEGHWKLFTPSPVAPANLAQEILALAWATVLGDVTIGCGSTRAQRMLRDRSSRPSVGRHPRPRRAGEAGDVDREQRFPLVQPISAKPRWSFWPEQPSCAGQSRRR